MFDSFEFGSVNGYFYDGKNLGKNELFSLFLDLGRIFFFLGILYKNRWYKFKW